MNQGFHTTFSSYSSFDPNYRNIVTFDVSGAYVIEPGVKMLFVMAVGGGAGGGGGGKFASGTFSGGGGGGSSGSIIRGYFLTEDLGGPHSVLNITIGTGGGGGTGPAGLGNNGSSGTGGGATVIDVNGCGTLLTAPGGVAGGGGTVSGNAVAQAPAGFLNYGIFTVMSAAGRGCTTAPAAGQSITVQTFLGSFGGGGGGGKTAANAILAGGSITAMSTSDSGVMNPNIVPGNIILVGGATDGQNGESNVSLQPFGLFAPGLGGAGGAGGFSGNAGNGGNGWRGGGGGGGGGGTNGFNSGTGGTGGNGYVAILAIRGD